MTGESNKFEGEFDILSKSSLGGEAEENIDKLDDFTPADMVYDGEGIQVYKNDKSVVMLKVIKTSPLTFVALYTESSKEIKTPEYVMEDTQQPGVNTPST